MIYQALVYINNRPVMVASVTDTIQQRAGDLGEVTACYPMEPSNETIEEFKQNHYAGSWLIV